MPERTFAYFILRGKIVPNCVGENAWYFAHQYQCKTKENKKKTGRKCNL